MVYAQINLNVYTFYSFHPILIFQLRTNVFCANALWKFVRLRSLAPGGPDAAHKWVNLVKFQNATATSNIKLK